MVKTMDIPKDNTYYCEVCRKPVTVKGREISEWDKSLVKLGWMKKVRSLKLLTTKHPESEKVEAVICPVCRKKGASKCLK